MEGYSKPISKTTCYDIDRFPSYLSLRLDQLFHPHFLRELSPFLLSEEKADGKLVGPSAQEKIRWEEVRFVKERRDGRKIMHFPNFITILFCNQKR